MGNNFATSQDSSSVRLDDIFSEVLLLSPHELWPHKTVVMLLVFKDLETKFLCKQKPQDDLNIIETVSCAHQESLLSQLMPEMQNIIGYI